MRVSVRLSPPPRSSQVLVVTFARICRPPFVDECRQGASTRRTKSREFLARRQISGHGRPGSARVLGSNAVARPGGHDRDARVGRIDPDHVFGGRRFDPRPGRAVCRANDDAVSTRGPADGDRRGRAREEVDGRTAVLRLPRGATITRPVDGAARTESSADEGIGQARNLDGDSLGADGSDTRGTAFLSVRVRGRRHGTGFPAVGSGPRPELARAPGARGPARCWPAQPAPHAARALRVAARRPAVQVPGGRPAGVLPTRSRSGAGALPAGASGR